MAQGRGRPCTALTIYDVSVSNTKFSPNTMWALSGGKPMPKITLLPLLLLVSCLVPGRLLAQGPNPAAAATAYGKAAKANAALLRQYTFQTRVALTVNGNSKPPMLYQMNFGPNGQLQKTLLSAPPPGPSGGFFRRHREEREADEFKKWAGQLVDVVKKYMAPTPGNMLDFFSKAQMTPGSNGTFQYAGSNFLQPGDTATFWINPQTKAPTRYAFNTTLQGDTVQGRVKFGQVPGGPRYPSQITVNVPNKQVNAVISTFNYMKQ
jgi:hypothetical protein